MESTPNNSEKPVNNDDLVKMNTNSSIYKRYEELKRQSNEFGEDGINENNASFYSALNAPSNTDDEEIETTQNETKEVPSSADYDLNYDLFNLNFKQSDEDSLYREKKLVNLNYNQKVENNNNKIEVKKTKEVPSFSFQNPKEDVNYQDTFRDLRSTNEKKSKAKFNSIYNNNAPTSTVDLKNKMYSAGYVVRAYQKLETDNFYSMRYYLSNKLLRDCSIITYLIMLVIIGIMWIAFNGLAKLPYYTYISLMAGFLIIPIAGIANYAIFPNKRKKAEFNFRLAMLNAIMLYLVATCACLLIAFFGIGADINDFATLIAPIVYPLLCLLAMPISVGIYKVLYSTKNYFIE